MYNFDVEIPFEDLCQDYVNAYVPGDWGLPTEPYPEPRMPFKRNLRFW